MASTVIRDDSADQRSARYYRSDIDGLRALAILPIVFFHLGLHRVSGGYVGVDVFFVISGYLIGGAVIQKIDAGTYSISDFYKRRFRRIIPALVVVLIATTIAALFIFFPIQLKLYGASLISAMLSVSNFYFWEKTDYFAAAGKTQPLLHTWSLAVEEQFYVFFLFWCLLSDDVNGQLCL